MKMLKEPSIAAYLLYRQVRAAECYYPMIGEVRGNSSHSNIHTRGCMWWQLEGRREAGEQCQRPPLS